MELVPDLIDNAVVFGFDDRCKVNDTSCGGCPDFAVAIHNWMLVTDVNYIIIDLRDEKEVCPALLVEILQLRKRLRYPFLFTSVMPQALEILRSYAFDVDTGVFETPKEAIVDLKKNSPEVLAVSLSKVKFGEPIPRNRPRVGSREEGEAEADS